MAGDEAASAGDPS